MNNKTSDPANSETSNCQEHFICDICKKEFLTKFHYHIHSAIHLLPEDFKSCHECLAGSAHILSLDKHLETHHDPAYINLLNEHAENHNNESANRLFSIQGIKNEKIPLNNDMKNEKYNPSNRLQDLFRCDRCKKGFIEKNHLEEHYQNQCIKKELNTDEYNDFKPPSLMATVFHASDDYDGNVTSSEVLERSENVRIFKKTSAYAQNSAKTQFVCEVCQKVFSNKSSLTIHFSTHSSKNSFKCRLCEKKFTLKCLLSAHFRTHKVKKVFCGVCRKGFTSKEKLFNHVYIHALVESFSCNICQMTFSQKSSLEKHHLKHTAEKSITTETKLSSDDRLQNLFKCDKCKKEFLAKDELEDHYQNNCLKKVSDESEEDIVLLSEFQGRKTFSVYKRTHSRKSVKPAKKKTCLTCEICNKKFSRKYTLDNHKHIHLGSFPHVCRICSKGFARLDHLKRHYKVHSKISQKNMSSKKAENGTKSTNSHQLTHQLKESRKLNTNSSWHVNVKKKRVKRVSLHACDVCSKKFERLDNLNRHRRIHTGETPFRCEICGANFNHKNTFNSHKLVHQKNVKCKTCGKSFASAQGLSSHSSIHGEHKAFTCEICRKGFTNFSHFHKHILTHTGAKQFAFECDLCGRRFAFKNHLTRHTERVHGKE